MLENDPNEVETTEVEVEETEEETEETTEAEEEKPKPSKEERERGIYNRLHKKFGKKEAKTETYKSKSDDLDYGVLAFLEVKGVKEAEHDFVQKELEKSGASSYKELFANEYFLTRLEKQRELNKSAIATPPGKRSNAVATDSVEYWASKPFSEVPRDMKAKVVAFKESKESGKGVFYNS